MVGDTLANSDAWPGWKDGSEFKAKRDAMMEEENEMSLAPRRSAACLLLVPAMARAGVSVSISPGYAQIVVGQTLQFSATVSGTSNHGVTWQVNNANGGSAAFGTVNSSGLFTAPSTLPNPAIATITAVSKADPSVSATATVTLLAHAVSGNTYYVATERQ